jgi:hypothetical protein
MIGLGAEFAVICMACSGRDARGVVSPGPSRRIPPRAAPPQSIDSFSRVTIRFS